MRFLKLFGVAGVALVSSAGAALAQSTSPIATVLSQVNPTEHATAVVSSGGEWVVVTVAVAGLILAFAIVKCAFR